MTTDDQIMSELRRVLDASDNMGVSSAEAAKAAFSWRTIDLELAELSFDSNVDQPEAALRSGSTEVRRLTFTSESITIEIEAGLDGGLIGQVIPPGPADVRLLTADGSTSHATEADALGVFRFDDLPPSPVCIECAAQDGSWTVRTAWIIV